MGILRGPSLNPSEGQFFEKLPKYGFQPIGITTYDNATNLSEIHFPVRVGHNFKTLTKGKLQPLLSVASKLTKYNFRSWNLRVFDLKKLTSDLDIIYSADLFYPYTYQAVKTGIPTIVTEWENIPFNVETLPYSKIKKYNRTYATHFVAITEKAKAALVIEGVSPDRISVLPAGIDCERFKPAERNAEIGKKLGISEDSKRILFVGRLVPEKGIFSLLNAFSMLLSNVQNVELLIVGSGSPSTRVQISRLIANLKIGHKVKYLGRINYSNMPQIHNLADVFCLPSATTKTWAEQFGYSIVEAMACGKPVISTSTGSIPEVVKDRATGILVKPNDPRELNGALEELILNRQERNAFGRNGREWVLQKFEANKIAMQLAEIYRKFI
ncbi:MAG: glycosyltransferase family 4 protein [Candidatus Bathyarchaeia archaeon]